MQKFIIPKINDIPCTATITDQDARHIFKVLRLTRGDYIHLTNGKGQDFTGQIKECSSTRIQLDIIEKLDSKTESPIEITLCTGMLKDKKMDLVIKHVTQLGIHNWIPFFCERSIPTPNPKKIRMRITRWETIAKESLKQCRRSQLPKITSPVSLEEVLNLSRNDDVKIAFWENATKKLKTLTPSKPIKNITLLIGPEGGFSKGEISFIESYGFNSYSLGPRILRAETAAISGSTLVQHIFGDI
ncbi:MAG: 16S rRNA (uracil(1498)-N(3))-methyltransferase [Desulfobacula sp.]|nr:16S rRNA (uracil(1498)-N(3))-methyltransferase [Desulfobacula sp.]